MLDIKLIREDPDLVREIAVLPFSFMFTDNN